MANMKIFTENEWDSGSIVATTETAYFTATKTQERTTVKAWRSTAKGAQYLQIDYGAGNTVSVDGAFIFGSNISVSGFIKFQMSADNFATTPIDVTLKQSGVNFSYIFSSTETYRYVRFYFSDAVMAYAFYEAGRAWIGEAVTPQWGFSTNRNISYRDLSIVNEADGGTVSSVEKAKGWTRTFKLDFVSKSLFDTVWESRGSSLPFVIVEEDISNIDFTTNPQQNTYYGRAKNWKYTEPTGYFRMSFNFVKEF